MTARIIASRAIEAYRAEVDSGSVNPEQLAADIAASESRDLVTQIVLAFSEGLADGKNEITALAEVTRRFSGTSPTSGTSGGSS